MSTYPFVSCLMPTFGRMPHRRRLVEEAVESFLRQTCYPGDRMELVILNDCVGQTLELPDDDWLWNVRGLSPRWVREAVIIYNAGSRAASIGEKRNQLTRLAQGDILLPWDDDDISLPHRILHSVAALYNLPAAEVRAQGVGLQRPTHGYLNPGGYWFWNETPHGRGNINGCHGLQIPGSIGYAHNCSAYTREAWQAVEGYPAVSQADDADMDARLKACTLYSSRHGGVPKELWWYIYRWGVSDQHLSGQPDQSQFYRSRGYQPHAPGCYTFYPHWEWPYEELTQRYLAKAVASSASVAEERT